jgi:hypothetical protein
MFSLLGGCRLLQDPAENRRDISAKLFGIFAHRKMAEPFHDGDAGAANRGRIVSSGVQEKSYSPVSR